MKGIPEPCSPSGNFAFARICYWVLATGYLSLAAGYSCGPFCCMAQSVWSIGQTLFYALCPMLFAPCSMLHALCSMPFAPCSLPWDTTNHPSCSILFNRPFILVDTAQKYRHRGFFKNLDFNRCHFYCFALFNNNYHQLWVKERTNKSLSCLAMRDSLVGCDLPPLILISIGNDG